MSDLLGSFEHIQASTLEWRSGNLMPDVGDLRRTEGLIQATDLEWSSSPPSSPLLPQDALGQVDMLAGSEVTHTYLYSPSEKVRGKVFFRNTLPNNRGLVFMTYGRIDPTIQEPHLQAFDYLGSTLASEGFVAVSIKHNSGVTGQAPQQAAQDFIDNINFFMKNFGASFSVIGRPLALVGHSESGNGAVLAADLIINKGATALYFDLVSAVIGLAPSRRSESEPLPLYYTDNLLILQGTHDKDGNAQGGRSQLYISHSTPIKSQHYIWCHGFQHTGFLGGASLPLSDVNDLVIPDDTKDNKTVLSRETQLLVTQNYVTMYLLWRLAGQAKYKAIFDGASLVSWTNLSSQVKSDITNKGLRIFPRSEGQGDVPLDFDNKPVFSGFFQDTNLSKFIDEKNPAKLQALDAEFSCMYQQSWGYVVSWDRTQLNTGAASPSISIDCSPDVLTMGFESIAFDAILINRSLLNNLNPIPVTVAVWFRHKSLPFLRSAVVPVNIEPSLDVFMKAKINAAPLYRSVLSTIKVPAGSFKLTDLQWKTYTKFVISFLAPTPARGRIGISNFRGAFT